MNAIENRNPKLIHAAHSIGYHIACFAVYAITTAFAAFVIGCIMLVVVVAIAASVVLIPFLFAVLAAYYSALEVSRFVRRDSTREEEVKAVRARILDVAYDEESLT